MNKRSSGRGFRDVVAWQKADKLASAVYRVLDELGPRHRWLVDQALRAAISVPANIAEGHGRGSRQEFLHFIDIARGSLSEVEYYLHFMANEAVLTNTQFEDLDKLRTETGSVLFGLWRSLKSATKDGWDHEGKRIHEEREHYSTS